MDSQLPFFKQVFKNNCSNSETDMQGFIAWWMFYQRPLATSFKKILRQSECGSVE